MALMVEKVKDTETLPLWLFLGDEGVTLAMLRDYSVIFRNLGICI